MILCCGIKDRARDWIGGEHKTIHRNTSSHRWPIDLTTVNPRASPPVSTENHLYRRYQGLKNDIVITKMKAHRFDGKRGGHAFTSHEKINMLLVRKIGVDIVEKEDNTPSLHIFIFGDRHEEIP